MSESPHTPFEERSPSAIRNQCLAIIATDTELLRAQIFSRSYKGDGLHVSNLIANQAVRSFENGDIHEGDLYLQALWHTEASVSARAQAGYVGTINTSELSAKVMRKTLDQEADTVQFGEANNLAAHASQRSPFLWHTVLEAINRQDDPSKYIHEYAVDAPQEWDLTWFTVIAKHQSSPGNDRHLAQECGSTHSSPSACQHQEAIHRKAAELLNVHEHGPASVFNRVREVLPHITDSALKEKLSIHFMHSWRKTDFSDTALEVFIDTSQKILTEQFPAHHEIHEHIEDTIDSVTDLLEMEGADPFELQSILLPWKVANIQYLGGSAKDVVRALDTYSMQFLAQDNGGRDRPRYPQKTSMGLRNDMLSMLISQAVNTRDFTSARVYISEIPAQAQKEYALADALKAAQSEADIAQLHLNGLLSSMTPQIDQLYAMHEARVSGDSRGVHAHATAIMEQLGTTAEWSHRNIIMAAFHALHEYDDRAGVAAGQKLLAQRQAAELSITDFSEIVQVLIRSGDTEMASAAFYSLLETPPGSIRAANAAALAQLLEMQASD